MNISLRLNRPHDETAVGHKPVESREDAETHQLKAETPSAEGGRAQENPQQRTD